jgi:hypothetical protein
LWETNCLPKHTPWMTTFHLPCSFDCRETRNYSNEVLRLVAQIDFTYAERIRSFLRQIYLVLNEKLAYALVGGSLVSSNRAKYMHAVDLYKNPPVREPHFDRCSRALAAANDVLVTGDSVVASRDGALVDVLELRCDRGIVEIPLLLNFE